MATCPTCGSTVAFGGVKEGNRRYCNKKCYAEDEIGRVAENIPDEHIYQLARSINKGACPNCNAPGPVDIHKSYSVYSVIIYTSWKTHEHVVCKKCALKQQATNLLGSMVLGWWGVPFGLIVTPIQIFGNLFALLRNPGTRGPSKNLMEMARMMLASKVIKETV